MSLKDEKRPQLYDMCARCKQPDCEMFVELAERIRRKLVELSGIEPLASSLRIQRVKSDDETPDDTE